MANLDVALRLRLINGIKAPSAEARRDLDALRSSAQRLNGVRAGGLAADLGRVATAGGRADASLRRMAQNRSGLAATGAATARLGGSLDALAGRAGQVDTALRRLGAERSGLGATGAASARLGADLSQLTTAAGRTDAALRQLGTERSGLAAGSAAASRLGNDLRALERATTGAGSALDRVGGARTGLATAGSATARLGGELAAAARHADRLAGSLARATIVVPRIRLPGGGPVPVPWGPAPGPWGPGPGSPRGPRSGRPPPVPPRPDVPPPGNPLGPGPEDRQRTGIVALGRGMAGAVGGIYAVQGAVRATVGEAISFEKAWAEVVKKVNDAPNPEAMQQLQRTVAKTAIDLGMERNGLAEMTAEAGAAGIKFQDLERYVRLAGKASVGWDMAPREAAQNLAEIKSAGQFSLAELDTLADKINALGDNSAAKEADIVRMFQNAAEGARMAGSSMDTTLAALTALKSGGMQADVAARFYGAFTSKLRTAGGEGKGAEKVNDALKEIGLNGKKVAQAMARDADAAITDVLTGLAKHADPVKVAQGLMGQEWWDELARFTGGSLAEFTKQRDFLRDAKNYKGSLDKGLDAQLSTTANHLERLKALAGDVGDRLGRWALPGINRGIQAAIQQVDELDRRRALAAAEARMRGEDPEKGDPIGRATTAIIKGAPDVLDKILDLTVARLPTRDPSRALVERRAKEARDATDLADKGREEAAKLEERAKGTKDKTARATLLEQARRARETASRQEATAAEGMRGTGPAGARDMTDVEYGEAAARASIEAKRQIALLERGLGAGSQANVRLPDTGTVMSRKAAEAELLAQRKRFEALGGPPAEPQAPPTAAPLPATPVMTVPLPPARPGAPAAVVPLPPIRPPSLTAPAGSSAQPEPTIQPQPTIQPAPTVQPLPAAQVRPGPTIQPAPTVQPLPTIQPAPTVQPLMAAQVRPGPTIQPAPTVQPLMAAQVRPGPTIQPAPTVQPLMAAQVRPAPAVGAGSDAAGTVMALQQRIVVLERALAGGSQANVRIPDTGIITARRGVEAEIADLRRRVESQRPAPTASAPERSATTASAPAPAAPSPVPSVPRAGAGLGGPSASPGTVAPKVDPQPALDGMRAVEEGAKQLKTTMGQDLSDPARESMQSYTAALKAGTAEAVAAVTAAVAQMKAALNFTASPTIAPRLVAPSGAAPAAKPATAARAAPAAPPVPGPRIQSASLRRGGGGGGVTITGPVHVHGVQNVASLHRQISRAADRRARDARDGALHDTGVESA